MPNFQRALSSNSKCHNQVSHTSLPSKKRLLKLKTLCQGQNSAPRIPICMFKVKNSLKSWRRNSKRWWRGTSHKMSLLLSRSDSRPHKCSNYSLRGIKKFCLLNTSKTLRFNSKCRLWADNLLKVRDSMIPLWPQFQLRTKLSRWFKRGLMTSKWPPTLMRWILMRKTLARGTLSLTFRGLLRVPTIWWTPSLEVMVSMEMKWLRT